MTVQQPLPWQMGAWQQLLAARREGRLSHAYLLAGMRGTGKLQLALALAQWRLCRDPADDRACGRCKDCHLFTAGSHPDWLDVRPEEGKTALRIDQIRAISDFVQQKAGAQGSARVVLLGPAEALGEGAANALLKSLEEPPGDALFLLVSHLPGRVMATIRSRCQNLLLTAPEPDVARDWLIAQEGSDNVDALDAVLALAPRQPLLARDYLQQGLPELHRTLEAAARDLAGGDADPLDLAAACRNFGPAPTVNYLQIHTAGRIRRRMTAAPVLGGKDAQHQQDQEGLRRLFRFHSELEQYRKQIDSTANPNPQLTLESLFLRWRENLIQCR